jgi:peptide/nickel transport system substrate-binding protein
MKSFKLLVAVSMVLLIIILVATLSFAAPSVQPKGSAVYVKNSSTWSMKGMDPHTQMTASGIEPCHMIYDFLVNKDENGKFIPDLATKWVISPDGLEMTFDLTKKAKFWDGSPVTAKDVKFSIERCMRPELKFVAGSQLKRSIKQVEIVNAYKVKIYFQHYDPSFLDFAFLYLAIVPKEYVEKVGDNVFAEKPMGSGPFKLVRFTSAPELVGEANTSHHRKVPYVKTMTIKGVEETGTRLAMLKTGEADLIYVAPEHIPEVQNDPTYKKFWQKYPYLMTLVFFDMGFPNESSPFKDPRVRMAASYAIDRWAIARLRNNQLEPWGSFLAPYHPGYDPSRKPDPYDPKKAKALLAAAGYPNGFDTVFTGHPTMSILFQAIVAQLAEVGIRCRLDLPEQGVWARSYLEGKLRGIGWGGGPWWVGMNVYAALESHTSGTWAPESRPYPEAKKAMDNIEAASLKGGKTLAKAARAADDLLLDKLRLRRPLFVSNLLYAGGPKVDSYQNVPGQVYSMRFEYLKLK